MIDYFTLARRVVDCELRERNLTSWEVDFLIHLGFRVSTRAYISDEQIEQLKAIHDRVTSLQLRV